MRKVILQEFITLDSLAAGPNDNVDYVPASTEGDKGFGKEQLKLMKSVDTILLGRKTYEMFAGYWPKNSAEKEIGKLKRQSGKNMVIWGSISLAQSVIKEGLIDEFRLVICPVVLGKGRPLFLDEVDSFGLKFLESSKKFDLGAVQLKYKPAPGKKVGKKRER